MEVKEINSVVSQFLSLRSGGASAIGGVLGDGFADLMEQTSAALVSKNDKEVKVADVSQKEKSPATVKTEDIKEGKKVKTSEKEQSTEKKETVNKNTKDKKTSEQKSDVAAVQNDVKAKTQEPVLKNESEISSSDAVVGIEAVSEEGVSPVESMPKTESMPQAVVSKALDSSAVAILNGNAMTMLSSNIDMQSLSTMSDVIVLDSSSGELIHMTGEDLVAKIQQASEMGKLFVSGDVASEGFVDLLPAEVINLATQDKTDSSSPSLVLSKAAFYEDATLAEQALILDDKLSQEQKIKVDVSVKEEKVSSSIDQGLIQDKVSLHKAVEASLMQDENADAGNPKNKTAQVQSLSQQQMPQSSSTQVMQGASAAVTANVAVLADNANSTVSVAKVAAVGEISGNAASQATIGSGEVLLAARQETVDKSNVTSFKDIYKGMSKEVVEQVKVNITKSAIRGVDKIDVSLKPEDLGHIEIKMQISKDGKLHAHIISSRPETMDILQKEAQSLEKAFNDAGFQTDDNFLSFSFRNDGQAGTEQERNAELRSFIGNVLESEQNEELVSNDNLLYWDPTQGLNIRV